MNNKSIIVLENTDYYPQFYIAVLVNTKDFEEAKRTIKQAVIAYKADMNSETPKYDYYEDAIREYFGNTTVEYEFITRGTIMHVDTITEED